MIANPGRPDPVVFFDGFCNLCSSSVLFILKFERKNSGLKFISLQSEKLKSLYPELEVKEPPESLIYYEKGIFYFKSDAALKIATKLRTPLRFLSKFSFVPRFIRDPVYMFIAENRYKLFGKKDQCFVPSQEIRERFISNNEKGF